MVVKCGREEFTLTREDDILFNGACYQIITQKVGYGFNSYSPRIAKVKAKKMIRDGELVFDRFYTSDFTTKEMEVYKIK